MSEQTICMRNIGPRECRKRLIMGIVMLAMGVGIAVVLIFTSIDRGWRLGLFLPFWVSALGFFQAREKT